MDESSQTQNRRTRRSNVLMAASLELSGTSLPVKLRNLSADGALVVGDKLPVEGASLIFRKGDPADNLYYLESGRVRLVEIGTLLPEGELFGEIAFFTDARERTLSARCEGPCRIASLDERTFMRLYYQNPAFGVHVVRLIARRLIDGMATRPDAYRTVASAQPPQGA